MTATQLAEHRQRVSIAAYKLWEDEGCPVDRANSHWLQAEAIVSAELAKPVKKPMSRSKTRKA